MLMKKMKKNVKSELRKQKKRVVNIFVHILLIVLSLLWVFPIVWIVMTSFQVEQYPNMKHFFPKGYTLNNYIRLFTDTSQFYFVRWFWNTLFVAVCSCLLSTFYVLCVSYTFSRTRFRQRKPMMNIALILNMFPGFMSMIAVYYVLKAFGITKSLIALILVYSGGAGLGFHIAKGFFDTLPRALDEAAAIDGATKWQVFLKITMPLSKPIIVYTVLTSFLAPWLDFIFAKVIMGDQYKNYTVAVGLWTMVQKEYIMQWYTRFTAGAVCVSIPIALLFITMQKYYVEGVSGAVKG